MDTFSKLCQAAHVEEKKKLQTSGRATRRHANAHASRARSAAAFAREAKRSERVHHSYVEGGTDPGDINHRIKQRHVNKSIKSHEGEEKETEGEEAGKKKSRRSKRKIMQYIQAQSCTIANRAEQIRTAWRV